MKESARRMAPDFRPERYELRIQGHLNSRWTDWLGCQELFHTKTGETILTCRIPDQAALHGLLAKIRDMNLNLISISQVDFERDHNNSSEYEEEI